ncbi:MAG: patatin-like phospholipase family protein [Acidobacteriota bacterium]
MLAWVQRLWRSCRGMGRVLGLCRFALATLLLVGFAMIGVPQGQDLLRFVNESLGGDYATMQPAIWFLLALWIWATSAWYFSRFILAVLLRPHLPAQKWFVLWLPRGIGAACFLALTVGLLRVEAWGLAAIAGSGAVAFVVFAVWGGAWMRRVGAVPTEEHSGLGVRAQPKAARGLAFLFALLAAALFVAFAVSRVDLPQRLGSAAIVMLAASTWIPFGTLLVYFGHRLRLPLLTLFFAAVAVFSFWNDNHALRLAPASPLPPSTESLRDNLGRWVAEREVPGDSLAPIPLVLVVAEGGGARAAYWTAHVLATLEEHAPGFSRRVYAISGVSGGAVGATMFAALMAEPTSWPADLAPSACHAHDGRVGLGEAARCLAGGDFLSPPLAGMLYADLMAHMSPWQIPAFDRARSLESAWEESWNREVQPRNGPSSDRLAAPFLSLWSGPRTPAVPNLILDGTWVETGQRAITTNLRLRPSPFGGALDVLELMNSDVPLSTAAHSAARFPLVSPAGRVDHAGKTLGHVVDGGYFENAGATAALEVLDSAIWLRDLHHLPLRLIVIAISNDPAVLPPPNSQCAEPVVGLGPPLRGMEALAPVSAVLNAREARSQFALRALRDYTLGDRDRDHDTWYFRFGLRQSGPEPLGWQLSRTSQKVIADQLEDPAVPFCNRQRLEDVVALLR